MSELDFFDTQACNPLVSDDEHEKTMRKDTKVDIPPPAPPDGTWKTIDAEALYDKDKCDLSRYELDTVYKLLE